MPLPAPVISATLFSSRLLITNVSLLYSSRPPVTPTAAAIACPAFSDGHGTRPAVCSARLAAGYGLWIGFALGDRFVAIARRAVAEHAVLAAGEVVQRVGVLLRIVDRKSTRLNSSHVKISYAVFCLKKKKMKEKGR